MNSSGQFVSTPASSAPIRHSRLALAALLFSIFSFIPPFGIAAVVLGHVSRRHIAASKGRLDGEATALAAMIIGYTQMALVAAALVLGWRAVRPTIESFRRDPWVQRVFRESDAQQTLDPTSAVEEENAARAILVQMMAIEEEYHRRHEGYVCTISGLMQEGVEGWTTAEKLAFRERVNRSAYVFDLTGCSTAGDEPAKTYRLAAVPRLPRMPEGSRVFCADETGRFKEARGGTSVDCFERGHAVLKPAPLVPETPKVEIERRAPSQEPTGPCVPSEVTPCGADMKPVRAAWTSPQALWDFLTSPEAGVKERRVAASKAGEIFPLDWLPRVIEARRQLLHEQCCTTSGWRTE